MHPTSVIIVGGGIAGFSTVRELRSRGFSGELTIVDENGLPYDRPPLSKGYLLGTTTDTGLSFVGQDWYTENSVSVVTGTVVALLPDEGGVELTDGRKLLADNIVLATGGRARKLPIPGGDLDSVLELRTREDADRLRSLLADGVRLAIIGAGLIGAEIASTAVALGADVILIDPVDPPLVPAVGPDLARYLHSMHRERGIRVIDDAPVQITRTASGHVVELANGQRIDADVVLAGIGISPSTDLAVAAGLEVDNGILVDVQQRTSHRRVYAVGDSSRTRLEDGTLLRRAEHWEHAANTGAAAAVSMLGEEVRERGASWFWSDRHNVHVEGVGSLEGPGTTVVRTVGDVPVATFRLDEDGWMIGCATVDGGPIIRAARRIIDKRIKVDPSDLADPGIDLKKLISRVPSR